MSIAPPTVVYSINGTPVAGLNWRQTMTPRRPAGQRFESIPGVPQKFVATGVLLPLTLIVTGMATAASHAALFNYYDATAVLRVSTALHTVVWHDISYPNMHLAEFEPTGEVEGIEDQGVHVLGVPVRYVWERLSQ